MSDTELARTMEVARRLGQLGQTEEACRAYTLALRQAQDGSQPALELEAALYLFLNSKDYRVAYTTFVSLYGRGLYRKDLLPLLTKTFYEPNVQQMKNRYEKNCKLLAKYPYLFRKDFLPFDQLSIQFFPYDDNGYLPYDRREDCFGDYVNLNYPKITRNFFRDLDKPILADDVYSMYELSYLNDNVRKSEWIGRENHIYLHYTDWRNFCAYLQVFDLQKLLEDEKLIFLIENEINQYPIDFKARYGVDYNQYPVKPIGIREINRLIWHTQLSAHNGGDFFNEIFDAHPNLITFTSVQLTTLEEFVKSVKKGLKLHIEPRLVAGDEMDPKKFHRVFSQLQTLSHVTDKDILVAYYFAAADMSHLDTASRIAPALFLQPHFPNIFYDLTYQKDTATLDSAEYQRIRKSPAFVGFPYIKTFTPIRRPTTSYAATVKFMHGMCLLDHENTMPKVITDVVMERILNRSFMIDPQDRLFQDSVLVRFEDGKLNPRATFTALAAFLDLPYTDSLTYCSDNGKKDPHADVTDWYAGFDLTGVYKTYDEYAGKTERYFLEYFMRDVYDYCGYDFHYYDGAPMDMDRVKTLVDQFDIQDHYMHLSWEKVYQYAIETGHLDLSDPENAACVGMTKEEIVQKLVESMTKELHDNRIRVAEILLRNPHFINSNGQPLRMMPKLQLDPALLEQPLYH